MPFPGRGTAFIHVGRGNVISESSLLSALDSGWIREAVLDVYREEPLSTGSPLWSHPGVVMTPHVAGASRYEFKFYLTVAS